MRRKQKKKRGKKRQIAGRPGRERPNDNRAVPAAMDRQLAQAIQSHQRGQLAEAASIYREILRSHPDHPDALHLLGVFSRQTGDPGTAVALIEKAIQLNADHWAYHENLGVAFQDQGKFAEAIRCYHKALQLQPGVARIHNSLGSALHGLGQLPEAVSHYQRAISLQPDFADAHFNWGRAYQEMGQPAAAIRCYQKSIEIEPAYAQAYLNMGVVHQTQGELDDAIENYRLAISRQPDWADAHNNLGAAYLQRGDLNKAVASFETVLVISPQSAQAHYNLANALKETGRMPQALACYKQALRIKPDYLDALNNMGTALQEGGDVLEAIACFTEVLRINPEHAVAHNNLGTAFRDLRQPDKAVFHYQQAIRINPNFARALNNMGGIHLEQGQLDAASTFFQKALTLKPDFAEACCNMGHVMYEQGRLGSAIHYLEKALVYRPDHPSALATLYLLLTYTCDWQRVDTLKATLDASTLKMLDAGERVFEMPFLSIARSDDSAHHFAVAQSWSRDIGKHVSNSGMRFSFEADRKNKNRITVGYLSRNFGRHPMAYLMKRLFARHLREEFEIICYACGPDDGSSIRGQIKDSCDKFVEFDGLGDEAAARRVYDDRVDILVDLMGHTKGGRLGISAQRPAPIQTRYLGMAGTTGADFIDYMITDNIVTPETDAPHYSETFAYLPHCYQVNDNTQEIADRDWQRADFGLPERGFVFCSFSGSYKIDPTVFQVWMNMLRQVPGSVLWLLQRDDVTERNLKQTAGAAGIDPERLVFAGRQPRAEHLARIALADLALDTVIVNGAATVSDVLWAGVPVLAVQGNHFASRMSSSILTAIGLPELITRSLAAYESLAVRLAQHPSALSGLRRKLAHHRMTQPLFDTPRFVKNLERLYKEMWRIYLNNQPPHPITIVEGMP